MATQIAASMGARPLVTIRPSGGWAAVGVRELWAYRDLFLFLVLRDLKVRYRQTALGVAWVVLQPLLTMLVFAVLFGKVMRVPSDGLPYPLFAFAGLLPWLFFSRAVTQGSASVVASAHLITKVYFPRLLIPAASVAAGVIDLLLCLAVFVPLLLAFGLLPSWTLALVPLPAALVVAIAFGVGAWLSAVNVRYRDVTAMVPLALQLWMFATPIIYPIGLVPARWQWVLRANPMTGVVASFRSVMLGQPPDQASIAVSAAFALVAITLGAAAFVRAERSFADIV